MESQQTRLYKSRIILTILFLLFLSMLLKFVINGSYKEALLFSSVYLIASVSLFLKINITSIYLLLPMSIMFWFSISTIGAFNITVLDTLLLIIFIYLILIKTIKKKVGIYPGLSKVVLLSIIVIVTSLFGAFLHNGFSAALISTGLFLKKWAGYILFPLIAPFVNKRLMGPSILIFLLAILITQVFTFSTTSFSIYGDRATSLFFNPNVFSIISILSFNFAIGTLNSKFITYKFSIVVYFVIILSSLSVLLSGSRTGTIVFFISLLYWIFVNVKSFKNLVRIAFVPVIISIFIKIFNINISSFLDRWLLIANSNGENVSVSSRFEAISIGGQMLKDSPFLGYGFGNFATHSYEYVATYGSIINYQLNTTDNQFVDTFLESGIIGGLAFILMIIILFIFISKNVKESIFMKISLINLIVLSVSGFSMPSFYSPFSSSIFWFIFSLGILELLALERKNKL